MYPLTDQKALSWSESQGGGKVTMKMFTSTTRNEDLFALSFPQSCGAEPGWTKPLWSSADPFVWTPAKIQFCFEIRHSLEFYMISWKINSIAIVLVELYTDTSGCFSLKLAILTLSYIGRIQMRSTPVWNWSWAVESKINYDSTKTSPDVYISPQVNKLVPKRKAHMDRAMQVCTSLSLRSLGCSGCSQRLTPVFAGIYFYFTAVEDLVWKHYGVSCLQVTAEVLVCQIFKQMANLMRMWIKLLLFMLSSK